MAENFRPDLKYTACEAGLNSDSMTHGYRLKLAYKTFNSGPSHIKWLGL